MTGKCAATNNGLDNLSFVLQNNPNLLPPEKVRVEKVSATPYPDGRRVKVAVELSPFREQPDLDIDILDAQGRAVAGVNVIGVMNFRTAFVLHLRGVAEPAGDYTVRVHLRYEEHADAQDTHSVPLHIPAPELG